MSINLQEQWIFSSWVIICLDLFYFIFWTINLINCCSPTEYCPFWKEYNAVCLVCSVLWQEHYYDPHSGQGYLAYRLKTVQRNTASDFKRSSKSAHQGGPRNLRETGTSEQLFGDGCKEAMSIMKHSSDQEVVKEKMKATFKHRQNMLHDLNQSSLILDHFPRFLDTPGLVRNSDSINWVICWIGLWCFFSFCLC